MSREDVTKKRNFGCLPGGASKALKSRACAFLDERLTMETTEDQFREVWIKFMQEFPGTTTNHGRMIAVAKERQFPELAEVLSQDRFRRIKIFVKESTQRRTATARVEDLEQRVAALEQRVEALSRRRAFETPRASHPSLPFSQEVRP